MPNPFSYLIAGSAVLVTGFVLWNQGWLAIMSGLLPPVRPEARSPELDPSNQGRFEELNQELAALKAAYDLKTETFTESEKAEMWQPVALRLERAAIALSSQAPQSEMAAETELRGAISRAGQIVNTLEALNMKAF